MKKGTSYFLLISGIILCIGYLGLTLFDGNNLNQLSNVATAGFLTLFTLVFAINVFKNKNPEKDGLNVVTSFLLVGFICFSMANTFDFVPKKKQETLKDFTNTNLNALLSWANSNDIEIIQQYEFSDMIPKYHIISQSVVAGTPLDNVTKIELVISDGPNYDKSIILPNMIGWSLEEVTTYIDTNFLNNVTVKFSLSDSTKNTLISQSKSGDMRRNDKLTLEFSLGTKDDIVPVALEDLEGKTLFKASLWLMMHGFKYQVTYEFSDTIERGTVISQKETVGETFDPNKDTIHLVVSKGKKIVVPNLYAMSMEEITNWIMENNLSVSFSDQYDEKIEIGKLIETNVKENDIIEEGTLIKILTSRGQLKMEEFNSLSEFRTWANKYGIAYEERFQFSNQPNGTILDISKKAGQAINIKETIVVTVSQGKAITIPNFLGRSKKDIQSSCNNLGLRCSFVYGNYSDTAKDYATGQNKRSGLQVISGSSLTITLSKGVATTKTLVITQSLLGSSYNATKNSLSSYFANNYPGVTFNFVAKSHNTMSPGLIHPSSPAKVGTSVTQGKTYTIWIISD